MTTSQKLYTLPAAAKVTGYSIATLKEEIALGRLRAKRRLNEQKQPTGSYRITDAELDRWIANELGDA
jgi:hypothetical protein